MQDNLLEIIDTNPKLKDTMNNCLKWSRTGSLQLALFIENFKKSQAT